MSNLGNKEIFAKNLKHYMELNNKDRNDVCRDLDIPYTTFAEWYNAKIYPRIDKIQILANYFNIQKSDLVEDKTQNKNNLLNKLFLIPIVGKVPAGEPLLAEDNIEGYLPIDPMMYNLSSPDNLFFLRVVGESMNNVVPDGAFVLIKKQDYAETGDVVVALVNGDNEATLKRFKQIDNSFVMLEPDSTLQEFTPRIINLRDTEFKIIGKVIGDFKKWS